MEPISDLLEFCIINVDKPSGPTSFKVADRVRKILGVKKTGHFGTLDPKVTGVLPIAINRACKLSGFFMGQDKEYVGKMYLHSDVSEEELAREMEEFVGKIMQKPPVKSRVKRVLRERNVNEFKILKFNKGGKIIEFHADVQAGTYIRKLISDLGERVGGAHMVGLRRVRAGLFKVDKSVKIEEIEEAVEKLKDGDEKMLREMLIPAEIIKEIVSEVQVKDESVGGLLNGKPLMKGDVVKELVEEGLMSVFCGERFIGIYRRVGEGGGEGVVGEEMVGERSVAEDIVGRAEFVRN